MRNRLLIAMMFISLVVAACNETIGDCYPVGQGGDHSGDPVTGYPTTGPGPSGGDQVGTEQSALSMDQCNDHGSSKPPTKPTEPAPTDSTALLQSDLNDPDPAGGITCTTPEDCLSKCNAQSKFCGAAFAVHPHKPPMIGDLYECIDRFPPASMGGSYTCLYRYPNGDACVFAFGAKFGPIHPPAPPPLCVYKAQ